MHHKAVVKLGKADHKPYNIQCSCGTGGDFGSKEEAVNWMTMNHFRFLQGINTAEFAEDLPKTVVTAELVAEVPAEEEEEIPDEDEEDTEDEEEKDPEEKEEGKERVAKKKKRGGKKN